MNRMTPVVQFFVSQNRSHRTVFPVPLAIIRVAAMLLISGKIVTAFNSTMSAVTIGEGQGLRNRASFKASYSYPQKTQKRTNESPCPRLYA